MAGKVECQPARAERACLDAVDVRHRHDQKAARCEALGGRRERARRVAAGARGCARRRSRPSRLRSSSISASRTAGSSRAPRSRPSAVAAARLQRAQQRPVTARRRRAPGPGGASRVDAGGEEAAGAGEDLVARAGEAAVVRAGTRCRTRPRARASVGHGLVVPTPQALHRRTVQPPPRASLPGAARRTTRMRSSAGTGVQLECCVLVDRRHAGAGRHAGGGRQA